MKCKICSQASTAFAQARLLGRHEVQYYQCSNCGFVQTEEPFWFGEAYADAITSSDLGLVARNLGQSKICKAIIMAFFDSNGKFVDYGGGYGLMVRLMRNIGYDFHRYDPLCGNIFAKGFDASLPGSGDYELVTAFEVFEHLVHPLEDIEKMLSFSSNILFSTTLLPLSNPKPGEWQYYGLEHGQHISIYTPRALQVIAEKYRLHLHICRNSVHLLSKKKVAGWLFDIVAHYQVASLLHVGIRRRSLTYDDFYKATGMHL
jgi:hypothetical protein